MDTGFTAEAGRLTIVDAPAEQAGPMAARLTRYGESDERQAALVGGVPTDRADFGELRHRVLRSGHGDLLFSGTIREELSAGRERSQAELTEALFAADAADVVEGLPDGLDAFLTEGGRSLSGGQQQRLMLARALLAAPDVLVLEDPTSSVDAHTEARIVRRVAAYRTGLTTVVFSDSPLWRNAADLVHRSGAGSGSALEGAVS
jgi:ABC-type multidrug transport system fused ATPase/permease subunit